MPAVVTSQKVKIIRLSEIPNPDTIAEFKIQTSNYDAGYGRNPGANVNVITKSGTNSVHGDAFEFLRDTILDANDFFQNRSADRSRCSIRTSFGGRRGRADQERQTVLFCSPISRPGRRTVFRPKAIRRYHPASHSHRQSLEYGGVYGGAGRGYVPRKPPRQLAI